MDIITIIILTGITNLTFALYSWQQVRNPESHLACKDWAQAHGVKAVSFFIYAIALYTFSDDLRWFANILILLGCWAEARAYNKLADAGIKLFHLVLGFMLASAIFSYMHFNSAPGPNNTMIVTASYLIAVSFLVNVFALYKLTRQHSGSVFPKVLLIVNVFIMMLCLIRGTLAIENPDYIITQALFSNQLFMFATFISALGNGIGFIGFLKERSDEKLQMRANVDYLTGIHNRQHFELLTKEKLVAREPFTLYFMDIDKFKSVNDRFGHSTGDLVLREFSKALLQIENRFNGVAGRLGGEEFGLVLPEQTPISHERILAELRSEIAAQGEQYIGEPMSFSCGACSSRDAGTVHDIMRKADVLLYKAKDALYAGEI
ncbi:hypothetical protein CWE08_07345 [Aliidiomarina iranensis]|uniref:diguanylate cyclase n=1 Tax=Aliidiomarina iranensis TaxID=1434071 RepID=A0A432VWD0_9GAMM|nr:GGDEF domain-containing protein [Aliidiomarina iranensis]RUO20909.1 hypothetical protein CWE08_07345 [Aliidiomarina iranensis]